MYHPSLQEKSLEPGSHRAIYNEQQRMTEMSVGMFETRIHEVQIQIT